MSNGPLEIAGGHLKKKKDGRHLLSSLILAAFYFTHFLAKEHAGRDRTVCYWGLSASGLDAKKICCFKSNVKVSL
jgi:hypothetical protein